MKEEEQPTGKVSIQDALCGVCGSEMEGVEDGYECPVCREFFAMGSKAGEFDKCLGCDRFVGRFPIVEQATEWVGPSNPWWRYCPPCRLLERRRGVGTVKDIVRLLLTERQTTVRRLESLGVPRDFIEFCLGDQ